MTFGSDIDLEGFKVISSFDIEKFNCQKLESEVFQLAVILYPTDLFNEKFLIQVRDCMLKLPEKHPVKRWILAQSAKAAGHSLNEKKMEFLNGILNSQFNLITDLKVKKEVIDLISAAPENTKVERLLKAYLYLMIGNITRSDNILRELILLPPREFYKGEAKGNSFYHRLTLENLEKVLKKFSRHPADRLTFYLFTLYLKTYLNDTGLHAFVEDVENSRLKEKLRLTYTEKIAPELVAAIRFSMMGEKRRIKILRSEKFSLETQSFWFWPYFDIDPLVSEAMAERIKALDKTDPLWSIYLLSNERLADVYFKRGGIPLNRRRSFLRKNLENQKDYMMSLYKLIELGDIDQELVISVVDYLTHD